MIKRYFAKRKLNIIFSVAAVAFMWIAWVIVYYSVGNPLIVPSFTATAQSFFSLLADGGFWLALANTFARTLLAFVISFAVAMGCTALASLSKCAKAFINPITVVLRTLPTMAVILLILKATQGNRTLSPVIVTVLVLLPMIYSQALAAVGDIDAGLIEMAEAYSLSRRDRLFRIYLPLIAPNILSQTGANLSLGLKVMISAEVLANTAKGLGGMMQQSSIAAEIAELAALTVASVILGLIVDLAFSSFERLTFKWKAKEGRND